MVRSITLEQEGRLVVRKITRDGVKARWSGALLGNEWEVHCQEHGLWWVLNCQEHHMGW